MAERSQKTQFLLFAADLAIFGRLLQSLKVAAGQWNFVQRLLDTLRDTISNFKPLASQFQEIYSFATKSGPICCNLPQPVDLPEEHPLKVDRGGQNVPVYQFSCSWPEVKPPNLIGLQVKRSKMSVFNDSENMLYRRTFGPTDGQTNGCTDQQTDRPANTHIHTHNHHRAYHQCYFPFHHHYHYMSAQKIWKKRLFFCSTETYAKFLFCIENAKMKKPKT